MVNLINCGLQDLVEKTHSKSIFCFGSGSNFENFYYRLEELRLSEKVEYIIDNNSILSGTIKKMYSKDVPIISFKDFLEIKPKDFVIVITSFWGCIDIYSQLNAEPSIDGTDCYVYLFMCNHEIEKLQCNLNIEFTKDSVIKIPKVIHYVWFGGKTMPSVLGKCIDSWHKFCPDYEVVRWDESNYDIKSSYCEQAYKNKQWAFVSDFARWDIIYNYGGIYLDTDVELLKSYDDLLYDDAFFGFNFEGYILSGHGFGAKKQHPIIKELRDFYNVPDKQVGAYYKIFSKYNIRLDGRHQKVDGISIYPVEVLCPVHPLLPIKCLTPNTYSIHHCSSTWTDKDTIGDRQKKKELVSNVFVRCFKKENCENSE